MSQEIANNLSTEVLNALLKVSLLKKNVLFLGKTASGKTTLMYELIESLPKNISITVVQQKDDEIPLKIPKDRDMLVMKMQNNRREAQKCLETGISSNITVLGELNDEHNLCSAINLLCRNRGYLAEISANNITSAKEYMIKSLMSHRNIDEKFAKECIEDAFDIWIHIDKDQDCKRVLRDFEMSN